MNALVDVRAPNGETVSLGHGALIGRLWTADLHVNDARVSEAHAMISLRGREVRMLALRGRFAVDGKTVAELVLAAGQRVVLATGVALDVLAVHLPEEALAVEAPGLARQILGGVSSLYGGARPRVVAGWQADADDHLWPTGDAWMRRTGDPLRVVAGDTWMVAGVLFRATAQRHDGAPPTRAESAYQRPFCLTARYDTVHVAVPGEPVVVLTGHAARVVSELAIAATALPWEDLARQCWPDADRDVLRHRWDVLLQRTRARLRAGGVRPDLLRPDGSGLVELVLTPEDRVVDAT